MEDQEIKERSQFNGQARPTPPTFYDYPDESGEVLFRVERRGKGFVEAGEGPARTLRNGARRVAGFDGNGRLLESLTLAGNGRHLPQPARQRQ